MIEVTQLKRGVTFEHDNQLLRVVDYEHRKMGRGKATIKVKVFNVRTGSRTEVTFNSGERIQNIRLEKRSYQYLYPDGELLVFMETEDFTQKMVATTVFGDEVGYLKDNLEIELLDFDGEVLDYNLPVTVELEVIEAENAVAGNTATGASKTVVCETGLKVKTPLFINQGDVIRIDTRNGEYLTRA